MSRIKIIDNNILHRREDSEQWYSILCDIEIKQWLENYPNDAAYIGPIANNIYMIDITEKIYMFAKLKWD